MKKSAFKVLPDLEEMKKDQNHELARIRRELQEMQERLKFTKEALAKLEESNNRSTIEFS